MRPWRGFLLIMICLGMVPVAQGQSEGKRVDKIEIQGLAGTRPEQVQHGLKTQVGKPFNSVDVRADLGALARILRTAIVQTEPSPQGGVIVYFVVTEYPRFRKLQVIGNQKMTTARIETLAKLKAGDKLDENVLRSFKRALSNEYKVLGMPQSRITLNIIDVPAEKQGAPPQADLQVVLDEGRQVLAKDLIIKGNKAFSSLRLRTVIQTKGSWSFIKNYFDEETFKEDLARLREYYYAHGYFDVKVTRGTFQERVAGGKTSVSPVIQIDEGTRYRFGKADVRGGHLFGKAELLTPFTPLEGKLFAGQKFGEAIDQLKALYGDHGLLTTEIKSEFHYDHQKKIVDVTIAIEEKDRIYVGKIKLVRPAIPEEEKPSWFHKWYEHISPPVKEEAVLSEVLLKPGEVYNKKLENDSKRRLRRLGVFNNETLKLYNEPTGEAGVHNMVIEAQEAMTGAISGGVGFGDSTGAFLFASFSEKNLHGEADVFSLQALLGTRDTSISATYLDRHLNGSINSLMNRLFYETLNRPGYRAQVAGLHSELGHPLDATWTAYLRGRLEFVQLSERDDYHPHEDVNQSYPVATARLRFEEDTRDYYRNRPRQGYLQSYGVEAGYAGGPLARFEGARDQYVPLTEQLTYRLNGYAGVMPYSASTLPIHERFFMGGDNDLRGFKYRGAGYHDSDDKDVPTGGAAKLLAKNELLFPIIDPVGGVVFADVGMLGKSPASWQAPRLSTGTGLRFDLNNVQVALDLAIPVLKQPEDETRFFHFNLQSQF